MNTIGTLKVDGELSALLIRADGTHREAALSRSSLDWTTMQQRLLRPISYWRKLYQKLIESKVLGAVSFAAFLHSMTSGDPHGLSLAVVTTAGVNYLAADMAGGGSDISAMNYHDSGTGTTAAAIGDTGLQTEAGPTTRATGTQSNPTANQYRSVGTISYTGTLAITEWGLFGDATRGSDTLWDRRVFSAVNVVNGDSISFTYTLTINAGGS